MNLLYIIVALVGGHYAPIAASSAKDACQQSITQYDNAPVYRLVILDGEKHFFPVTCLAPVVVPDVVTPAHTEYPVGE